MSPTTVSEAPDQCEALWAELASTGSYDKHSSAEQALGYVPPFGCPACAFALATDEVFMCLQCPIKAWAAATKASPYAPCADEGPFKDWLRADNAEERKAAAAAIRQLIAESR